MCGLRSQHQPSRGAPYDIHSAGTRWSAMRLASRLYAVRACRASGTCTSRLTPSSIVSGVRPSARSAISAFSGVTLRNRAPRSTSSRRYAGAGGSVPSIGAKSGGPTGVMSTRPGLPFATTFAMAWSRSSPATSTYGRCVGSVAAASSAYGRSGSRSAVTPRLRRTSACSSNVGAVAVVAVPAVRAVEAAGTWASSRRRILLNARTAARCSRRTAIGRVRLHAGARRCARCAKPTGSGRCPVGEAHLATCCGGRRACAARAGLRTPCAAPTYRAGRGCG